MKEKGEEDEVISPPKKFVPPHWGEGQKLAVTQNLHLALNEVPAAVDEDFQEAEGGDAIQKDAMLVDGSVGGGSQIHVQEKEKKPKGTYRKKPREEESNGKSAVASLAGKKHGADLEEKQEQDSEKWRKEDKGRKWQTKPTLMRDWRTSPARTNEDFVLELPGVGKPLGSSGTSGSPEVGRGGHSVFV